MPESSRQTLPQAFCRLKNTTHSPASICLECVVFATFALRTQVGASSSLLKPIVQLLEAFVDVHSHLKKNGGAEGVLFYSTGKGKDDHGRGGLKRSCSRGLHPHKIQPATIDQKQKKDPNFWCSKEEEIYLTLVTKLMWKVDNADLISWGASLTCKIIEAADCEGTARNPEVSVVCLGDNRGGSEDSFFEIFH